MNHAELSERIQTVLDGLATPDEERELDRLLARHSAAHAEFVQWQRLFVALGRVPQASPPEGLVAAVGAAASARLAALRDADQLFERRGVIGYEQAGDRDRERRSTSWFQAHVGRRFRSGSSRENGIMSEQQQRSGFGNRKLWAGGAVAVLAVGVAMVAFDLPPKSADVTGTIAPAERYRAPQDASAAIKLGDQTIAQLMQNDGFDRVIKDPQMKALSQDTSIRLLAQVLSRSPEMSRLMLEHLDATRAATENVALAQAMLANLGASRAEFAALQATKTGAAQQAARVAAEAGRLQSTGAQEASRAAVDAGRQQTNAREVSRAELASMMAGKLEASQAILSSAEASRAAVENLAVAQAVLANLAASRMLMSNDASRMALSTAEAGLMQKSAEASRLQLDRAASAERNNRAGN